MPINPEDFLKLARIRFHYLEKDFQFLAQERIGRGSVRSAEIVYDSVKLAISPEWDSRDSLSVSITAKQDTFWIRPASSHNFTLAELLQLVAPEVLEEVPRCSWPEETKSEVDQWLGFHAQQLGLHGAPLLRGDLSLCEDMLIMRYCNSAKGLPLEAYLKVFREHCATLQPEDQEHLEAAIAPHSTREIYFVVRNFVDSGRLRQRRLLMALQEFLLQYLQ